MAPKGKALFSEGEKVLCFHGPLIYEAKCLKVQIKDKFIRYFIHYAGWNKNWDEWVPETRVLKFEDTNLQKQKEVKLAHEREVNSRKSKAPIKGTKGALPTPPPPTGAKRKSDGTKKAPGSDVSEKADSVKDDTPKGTPKSSKASTPSTAGNASDDGAEPAKKKRVAKIDSTIESEEQFTTKVEIKIKVPDELKPCLVDDWDMVTRQRKLLNLPAQITVDDILEKYRRHKKSSKANNSSKESAVSETTKGIREYFNVTLGTQLLYKFERPQYSDLLREHPDKPMSSIYGAIHLLRLFVKLGGMLAFTPLDDRSIHHLQYQLHEFLRYLQKNSQSYFSLQDYGIAPPEYQRKTM